MLALGLQVQAFSGNRIRVDNHLPAGNIVVEKISGDTVYVQPDMTGHKGEWFYWAMRVRGAQGRTLVFKFPRTCVGARGAVVSLDRGKTFFFSGERTNTSFTWTFGPKDNEVYFYELTAFPLFLVAMLLISALFTLPPSNRRGGIFLRVLGALGGGFGLYFFSRVTNVMGLNGSLPLFLAAWGPALISIPLCLSLLLHYEDG